MPTPEHKQKLRIANTIAVFMALTGGLIGLNELVHEDKKEPEIVPVETPEIKESGWKATPPPHSW